MDKVKNIAYDRIAKALKSKATTSLEDALFINKESRNPDHIIQLVKIFAQGFISHPESWWATNIQILASLGYLGEHQKRFANIRQAIFSSLVGYALRNPVRTGTLYFWAEAGHLDEFLAGFAGRYLGATLITNKAIFSEKFSVLGNSRLSSIIKFTFRLIHSCYGQAMLAISQGVRSLENLLFSMLTGSIAVLDGNFYNQLKELNISDYEAHQVFDKVKPFLQSLMYCNTEASYREYAKKYFL